MCWFSWLPPPFLYHMKQQCSSCQFTTGSTVSLVCKWRLNMQDSTCVLLVGLCDSTEMGGWEGVATSWVSLVCLSAQMQASGKKKKELRYRSVISDIFDGSILSLVQCLTCDRVSLLVAVSKRAGSLLACRSLLRKRRFYFQTLRDAVGLLK